MSAPMDFLMRELRTDDAQTQIATLGRLRVIGLALGMEKTRTELIPFLGRQIEDPDAKLPDEVKVTLAEVLGGYVDFVGGPSEAHCLLPPLILLCKAEESSVRDAAVSSINTIGKKLSKQQLHDHLYAPFMELAKGGDWFTLRVSACGLCALMYSGLCSDDVALQEISAVFCEMGKDETPMVRRAAATKLADVAAFVVKKHLSEQAPPPAPPTNMVKLLDLLLKDEQESVRVNAVKAIPALCKRIVSLKCEEACESILGEYDERAGDKSWRVRNACADVIAEVATAASAWPVHHERLKAIYLRLAKDHEGEVRIATALKGDLAAAALGPAFAAEHIFKIVNDLVMEPTTLHRFELAEVLAKLAGPLGKQTTTELVVPPIVQLVEPDAELANMNVRLAVIKNFETIIDVVGLESGSVLFGVLTKLASAGEKKWRVRHAIVLLLPKIAKEMGVAGMEVVELKELATSDFALVREDFAKVLPELTETLGVGWLKDKVLPILAECAKHEKFQIKSVVLMAMSALKDHFNDDEVQERLLSMSLPFLNDNAPNLRIAAVQHLKTIASVAPAKWESRIKPELQNLASETDHDVQSEVSEAMKL